MELFRSILRWVILTGFLAVLGETANVPPSLVKTLPSEPTYIFKTLGLYCLAAGSSQGLLYDWYINGDSLNMNKYAANHDTTTGLLTIPEPVPEGYYQCKARNTFGVAVSNITRVIQIQFSADPSDRILAYSARIGDAAVIPCNTTGARIVPKAVYSWQLVNSRQDTNFRPIIPDRRLQIDEQGNLHFSYVQQSDDQGGLLYRCNLINVKDNSRSMSLSFTSLKVLSSQADHQELSELFITPSPVTGLLGGNVTLRCFFGGRDDIVITWRRADGKVISGSRFDTGDSAINSGSLIIYNIQLDDEVTYICTGRSAKGSLSIERNLDLKVEASPYFANSLQAPGNINATVGTSVTISCMATAIPDVDQVIWLRNGDEIKKTPLARKYSLSGDGRSLTINELCKGCGDEGDLSVIQCNSSNRHGYVLGQGYVNVFEPTVIVTPPMDVDLHWPDPIQFSCLATTDNSTSLVYTWTWKDLPVYDGRVNTSEPGYLSINITSLEDQGEFFLGKWGCNVSNGISHAYKSAYLVQPPVIVIKESKPRWKFWWVILLVLLILLLIALLIFLIGCYMYLNRGNQYPVDEKERQGGNDPEKELAENGFHDYQRPSDALDGIAVPEIQAEFPNSRGPGSISSSIGKPYSQDNMSLNDFSLANPGQYTEDGSFIAQYNSNPRMNPVAAIAPVPYYSSA